MQGVKVRPLGELRCLTAKKPKHKIETHWKLWLNYKRKRNYLWHMCSCSWYWYWLLSKHIYLGINSVLSFIICSANLLHCTFQFTPSLIYLPFTWWIAWKQELFQINHFILKPWESPKHRAATWELFELVEKEWDSESSSEWLSEHAASSCLTLQTHGL